MTMPTKEAVDEAEVVICTFPDAKSEDGRGLLIIKGERIIYQVADTLRQRETKMLTIPCEDREEAWRILDKFGDINR
jgi:hypothetical protein